MPTLGNGKICYVEIPATDIDRSSAFYERVFGWKIRRREDGSVSFDDGVGQVSGVWVLGRTPAPVCGLLLHIMVDSADASLEKIAAHGGAIVEPVGAHFPEITAKFRDPGGNVLGIYQETD